MKFWQTSRRRIAVERPLVMGILNVTPDSFSDGGRYSDGDLAIKRVEEMIDEGVNIIDVGGESTRPNSLAVDAKDEIARTAPIINEITRRFDTPISIDTTKTSVARAAIDAGAEIINDISGLRWEPELASLAGVTNAGLILMHSRGDFATMHLQPPVEDILAEAIASLTKSLSEAKSRGVDDSQLVLDIGLGFGKTAEQNLELIAKLDKFIDKLRYPTLVGASRKSFIGRLLNDAPPSERLGGSIAVAVLAVSNGAKILRVHDVKETVSAIKVATAIVR